MSPKKGCHNFFLSIILARPKINFRNDFYFENSHFQRACFFSLHTYLEHFLAEDLQDDVKEALRGDLPHLVDTMWERCQPILKMQRMQDLRDKIRHLNEVFC